MMHHAKVFPCLPCLRVVRLGRIPKRDNYRGPAAQNLKPDHMRYSGLQISLAQVLNEITTVALWVAWNLAGLGPLGPLGPWDHCALGPLLLWSGPMGLRELGLKGTGPWAQGVPCAHVCSEELATSTLYILCDFYKNNIETT